MKISDANIMAEDWHERTGKHPKQLDDGRWRWICPEPGKENKTSNLPRDVFDCLKSTQEMPWIFLTRTEAVLMAKIAAARAILAGFDPY